MCKEYLSGMRRTLFSSTLILMVLAMAIWSITLLFITPLNYCQMDCSMVWCVHSLIGCVVCSIVWICSFFNKPIPWKHEIRCDEGVVQQKDLFHLQRGGVGHFKTRIQEGVVLLLSICKFLFACCLCNDHTSSNQHIYKTAKENSAITLWR